MLAKWIQNARPKHGALHKQLGIPESRDIPPGLLHELHGAKVGNKVRGHKVTTLLKERVDFAVNAQKRRRR